MATQQNKVKWDDPANWKGVTVGDCKSCEMRHVLRNGMCWDCEQGWKAMNESQNKTGIGDYNAGEFYK